MSLPEQLAAAEATLAQKQAAAAAADHAVAEAQAFLAEATTRQERVLATRQLARATSAQKAAHAEVVTATAAVQSLRDQLAANPPVPIGTVPGDVPLVLLPVRLETRFQIVNGQTDLLIRIYPDDIHIDTHEPELTSEELEWGRHYWEQAWRGGASDANERLAWTQIADAFSPQRAAWIVGRLTPTNPAARPQSPVNADAALPTPPMFPTVPLKAAAQTRAPLAQLLPDFWVALGYNERGRVVTGISRPVRPSLAAGPAPSTAERPGAGETAVDAGMAWLVDFNEALAAGMAIRMPLPAAQAQGLRRLLVTGLRAAGGPEAGATQLASLLDAQHYTRGVEVLRRGTPTNNSTTSRSPIGGDDVGHEASYASERGPALVSAEAVSAGALLSRALGVPADTFAHLAGADNRDASIERDVNTMLWPSTIGYFLDQRLRGLVIDAELRTIRRHFINHVRSGGPLAALRLGRQPYGVLPVTSLDRWMPDAIGDAPARAVRALQALRDAFRRALVNVPRLEGTDLDQDLVAVLQMQPVSTALRARPVLGSAFVENHAALVGVDLDAQWWKAQADLAAPTVAIQGLPAVTPQSTAIASARPRRVDGPLAQTSTYTAALAGATAQQLRTDALPGTTPRPLFDRLARHGLLLEYSQAARRLSPQATPLMPDVPEPELIDIDPQPTITLWRRLTARLTGFNPAIEIGAYLDKPDSERDPAVTDLGSLRQALRNLSGIDGATLERLLLETLDLGSHRLDAWITSLATGRLDALRQSAGAQAVIGAFGWVEDLKPSTARVSDGYLQGPSPDHAAAAALLASGFLSHRADAAIAFAIDLSSKRVQPARQLLDGVRRGGNPAALLGYRLERLLHESALDAFVQPLRALAPLVTDSADAASRNVCHGATLLNLWRQRDTNPRFRQVVPASAPAAQGVDRVFARVDDEVDALSDLLLSDSVFQVGRGKRSNLVTSFDAIVRGESFGEAEILKTPRSGAAFLHRIVLPLADAPVASPWSAGRTRARATAEPRLNAWLGSVFGDPRRVMWTVRAGAGDAHQVDLSMLDLSPLDLVLMNEREFMGAVARHARQRAGDAATADRAAVPAGALSLDELALLLTAAREVVGTATALGPANLSVPEDAATADIDVEELRARTNAALTSLKAAATQLAAAMALEPAGPAAVEAASAAMTQALDTAREFGVLTDTPEGAAVPVDAVFDELGQRAAKAEAVTASDAIEVERARMAAIFGSEFRVLPRFVPRNAAELQQAFAASAALQGGDPDAAHTWLSRQSMVHEGAGRLADLARVQRALARPDAASAAGGSPTAGTAESDVPLVVAQLPFRSSDRWVALPFVPGQSLAGRRVSLVSWGSVPSMTVPIAGLLIDEWTERVPSPTETTGLAFHVDEPEARAPQSILIAVAPDVSQPWTLDALEAVLLETLELSQLRMVDATAMVELDHYLPATYVAANAANEAVSTDL